MRTRPRPVDHYIRGLQVAMQNSSIVRRQSRAQLLRYVDRLGSMQASDALQKRRKIFAVDVLHREKVAALEFADVVDAADIGMRNLASNPHLGEQPLAPHGIIRQCFGQ